MNLRRETPSEARKSPSQRAREGKVVDGRPVNGEENVEKTREAVKEIREKLEEFDQLAEKYQQFLHEELFPAEEKIQNMLARKNEAFEQMQSYSALIHEMMETPTWHSLQYYLDSYSIAYERMKKEDFKDTFDKKEALDAELKEKFGNLFKDPVQAAMLHILYRF